MSSGLRGITYDARGQLWGPAGWVAKPAAWLKDHVQTCTLYTWILKPTLVLRDLHIRPDSEPLTCRYMQYPPWAGSSWGKDTLLLGFLSWRREAVTFGFTSEQQNEAP